MVRGYQQCGSCNTRGSRFFLNCKPYITRTRRAHQVTAASLNILVNKAYDEYKGARSEEDGQLYPLSLNEWKEVKTMNNYLMDLPGCFSQICEAIHGTNSLASQVKASVTGKHPVTSAKVISNAVTFFIMNNYYYLSCPIPSSNKYL